MYPYTRNFLSGFDDFAKNLNIITKANNTLHPTWFNLARNLSDIARPSWLNSFNHLTNFGSAIQLNSDLHKAFSTSGNIGAISFLSKQLNLTHIHPSWAPNHKFKHSSIFNGIELLGNSIRDNITLYDKHLSISADITQNFVTAARLTPSLEEFSSSNFLSHTSLNTFDILSANTFLKELEALEDEEKDPAAAYEEVAQLLKENNALLQELLQLQSTAISLIAPKQNNQETWHHLLDWNTLAEHFMNKILILRFGINPGIAKTIMLVLWLTIIPITVELWTEARGGETFDNIVGKKESGKEPAPNLLNYLPVQPTPPTDITITPITHIYPITNANSRWTGTFSNNTTVTILKIKPKWCLVEGIGTIRLKIDRKRRNKLSNTEKELGSAKKLKGWIRKDNLDMFQ